MTNGCIGLCLFEASAGTLEGDGPINRSHVDVNPVG